MEFTPCTQPTQLSDVRQPAAGVLGLASPLPVRGGSAHARRDARRDAGGDPQSVVGRRKFKPGKVKLDLPPLVENGNTVPLTVAVESPMTRGRSREGHPRLHREEPAAQRRRASASGRAPGGRSVSTRIRLADTQNVIAIAELSDGSFWSDSADVVVTLAACLEEAMTDGTRAHQRAERARRGEVIEIKTLISHPMETGFRRTQLGAPIPRDIITPVRVHLQRRGDLPRRAPSRRSPPIRSSCSHTVADRERHPRVPVDRRQRLLA